MSELYPLLISSLSITYNLLCCYSHPLHFHTFPFPVQICSLGCKVPPICQCGKEVCGEIKLSLGSEQSLADKHVLEHFELKILSDNYFHGFSGKYVWKICQPHY